MRRSFRLIVMARIAFWVTPVQGPINASRRLVKDLRARGHSVVYVGPPRSRVAIGSSDVPFVPVFTEWFPADNDGAAPATARSRTNPAQLFFRALAAGDATSLEAVLKEWKADLLLLPSCFHLSTVCALLAHRAGVPSMYVTSIFLRDRDQWAAPFSSEYCPSSTLGSAIGVTARWWLARVHTRCRAAAFRLLHGMTPNGIVRELARHCGFPARLLTWRDLFSPRIAAPEIVLYPECLDLPGGQKPGRVFGSASIDLERREPDFPIARLREGVPLIYCAMGTQADGYVSRERLRRFYQAVIDACAALTPPVQLVAAVDQLNPDDFRHDPERATVVRRAPQLALLRRATLMINHGGPNSVKECAYFGVPVVVFPLGFDQPATAARVQFHGLGAVGSFRDARPTVIRALIEDVLRTPFFRVQAQAMRRRIQEADRSRPELEAIDVALAAGDATRTLHRTDTVHLREALR